MIAALPPTARLVLHDGAILPAEKCARFRQMLMEIGAELERAWARGDLAYARGCLDARTAVCRAYEEFEA